MADELVDTYLKKQFIMSASKLSRMKELMSKDLLDIDEAKELGRLRMEYLLSGEELVEAC